MHDYINAIIKSIKNLNHKIESCMEVVINQPMHLLFIRIFSSITAPVTTSIAE